MDINFIGVIGAGLMGTGIAQTAATAGYQVVLRDVSPELLEKSRGNMQKLLQRNVDKGKMTSSEMDELILRIRMTTEINDLSACQLVIEAVPEEFAIKSEVLTQLEGIVSPGCIIASNTSALSIAKLAGSTGKPDRVIGMHFFYPAQVMKLVELTMGNNTSRETFDTCAKVCRRMGKEPVQAPDTAGFLVNRLLTPLMNEAAYCVMEGADPRDVDKAMKLGANFPMGPLELADFVGLDTLLNTQVSLYEGFHDAKYRPCPLLKKMVEDGLLGKKTGKGFYTYEK